MSDSSKYNLNELLIVGYNGTIPFGVTPRDLTPIYQTRHDEDINILLPHVTNSTKISRLDHVSYSTLRRYAKGGLVTLFDAPIEPDENKKLRLMRDNTIHHGTRFPHTIARLFLRTPDALELVAEAIDEIAATHGYNIRSMCRKEDLPRVSIESILAKAKESKAVRVAEDEVYDHSLDSKTVIDLHLRRKESLALAKDALTQVFDEYGYNRKPFYDLYGVTKEQVNYVVSITKDAQEIEKSNDKKVLSLDEMTILLFANKRCVFPLIGNALEHAREEMNSYREVARKVPMNYQRVNSIKQRMKTADVNLVPEHLDIPDPLTTLRLHVRTKSVFPMVRKSFVETLGKYGSKQKVINAIDLPRGTLDRTLKLLGIY